MRRLIVLMLHCAIIVPVTMGFTGQSIANPFFQDCSGVLGDSEFSALKKYLDSQQELPSPDKCFRLNNHQFLLTVTDTGRVGQGLYFYDAKTGAYDLDGGRSMPNIAVDREFMGPNNKRYVLLSGSNLSHGNWWQSYSILNLTPTKNGKSYVHYDLLSWSEDPEVGLCGHLMSTDRGSGKTTLHKKKSTGTAFSIEKPQVINEGNASVQVVFSVTEQNCETSNKTTYNRLFTLSDGMFKETKK